MGQQGAKQRIIETASELFSEFGFRGVSMDSIARKMNFTKPALYYHFKSKKELYFEAANNSFERLMNEMKTAIDNKAKAPKKRLMEMSQKYIEFGMKRNSFFKITTHGSFEERESAIPGHLFNLKTRTNKMFEKIIDELYKERMIFGKRKPKDDAALLIGTMEGIMINTSLSGKKEKKIGKQIEKIVSLISKVDN